MSDLDAAIRAKLAADEAGDEYWPNYKDAIEAVLDLRREVHDGIKTARRWGIEDSVRAIAGKLGVEVDGG